MNELSNGHSSKFYGFISKTFYSVLFTLIPMMVCADEIIKINGIYYSFNSEYQWAFVETNPNYYKGEVVIPETVMYNGINYEVVTIKSEAFKSCEELTSVTIPNSVMSIARRAFWGCNSLESITFGNKVDYIGEYAFAFCSSLTSIEIPSSVKEIDIATFQGCI